MQISSVVLPLFSPLLPLLLHCPSRTNSNSRFSPLKQQVTVNSVVILEPKSMYCTQPVRIFIPFLHLYLALSYHTTRAEECQRMPPLKHVKPPHVFKFLLMRYHRAAQRKVLTTIFRIHKLTDAHDCLVLLRLTEDTAT